MDNLVKLLDYKDNKLLVEGYDLVEMANLDKEVINDFLLGLKIYLYNKKDLFNGQCQIFTSDAVTFKENKHFDDFKGEILVDGEEYELFKKIVFDFAYKNFSRINAEYLDRRNRFYNDSCLFVDSLLYQSEYYRCFEKNYYGWVSRISKLKIDMTDQEKRYSLIRKK